MSKKKALDIFTSVEDVAKAFAPNQTAFFQEALLDKSCPETIKTLNNIRKKEQEKAALYRRIQNANEAIDFHKQHLLNLQKSKTPYYVYMVFVDGEVKYVGKGSGDRYKHPVSGCSSVKSLNKDYFDNKYIEVVFVQENLSEEVALKLENVWLSIVTQDGREVYNKNFTSEYKYIDSDISDFYDWFTHAIDNSDQEGVRKMPLADLIKERDEQEEV